MLGSQAEREELSKMILDEIPLEVLRNFEGIYIMETGSADHRVWKIEFKEPR